jgi:double-strand break repair protein MRE11
VKFQVISEQKLSFKNKFGHVNYEDPNFNIGLPIFAIHGNHDDPTGENGLSALDLLSTSNFLNYFGKTENIDDIHVKPILIQKGETKIALYGLGNIRDERLYRTFQQKKVKFYREKENPEDYFNLFVIHQNRNQHHTAKSSISESMLRGFFDLVVWGHEHEQRIKPQWSPDGSFDVMQPGSSIITDLNPEEVVPKKIALLEICKNRYRITPLQLQTNRVFIYQSIALDDDVDVNKSSAEEILKYLGTKMQAMIGEANGKLAPKSILDKWPTLKLPLFRLRVEYPPGFATINPQRFGQKFVDVSANPASILLLARKKPRAKNLNTKLTETEEKEESVRFETSVAKIDDFIVEILQNEKNNLSVLNVKGLHDAVTMFVDKEEKDAIESYVTSHSKKTCVKLYNDLKGTGEEEIEEFLTRYQGETDSLVTDSLTLPSFEEKKIKSETKKTKKKKVESEEEEEDIVEKPKRGRGRGAARGGRGSTRGARGGKSAKFKKLDTDDEAEDKIDDDSEENVAPKRKRGETRGSVKKEESVMELDSEDDVPPPKKKKDDDILEISSDPETTPKKKTVAASKKK